MNSARLLDHFDRIAEASDAIPRLRRFILDLAVRGKLVEQDVNDEPASELLKRIQAEKMRLVKAGKFKLLKPFSIHDLDNIPYDLPGNWVHVPFGETIDAHYGGGTPSKNNSLYWDGDIHWASVKDVGKSKYIDTTIDRITEAGLENSSSNLIPPGNLIVVTRMGLGKVSINRVPVSINQDLRALFPSTLVSIDYQYIFFKTHGFEGTGLTVKGIKVDELLNVAFPLPPLAEQHRIVAKVDELMALCDRLEASQAKRESRRDRLVAASVNRISLPEDVGNGEEFRHNVRFHLSHLPRLTTRLEHIKALRQAIHNLAVQGKLVPQGEEKLRADDIAAQVRLERKREKAHSLSPGENAKARINFSGIWPLPPAWVILPLSDLALEIVDCPHSTPIWAESGKVCVRTSQFRPGYLSLSSTRFVSEETFAVRIKRLKPCENDILYSREGGILGVACRVPPHVELCLGQRMMLIRSSSVCLPAFLELVLNSPLITGLAKSQTTGGAAPRINVSIVKSYPIPLPPLAEQLRIIAKVEELMALCDELEVQLSTSQTDRSRLLEATLRAALAGASMPIARPRRPAPSQMSTQQYESEKPIQLATPCPVQIAQSASLDSLVEKTKADSVELPPLNRTPCGCS